MNRKTTRTSSYRPVLLSIVTTRWVWYRSPSINSNPHIWNGKKSDNKFHNMVGPMPKELLTISSIQWPSSCWSIVWIHNASSFPCPSSTRNPSHLLPSARISPLRNLVAFSSPMLPCMFGRVLPSSPTRPPIQVVWQFTEPKIKSVCFIVCQFNTRASRISATGVEKTVSMYVVGVLSWVLVYAEIRATGFAQTMAFRNAQQIPCWKRNRDSSQLFHLLHVEGSQSVYTNFNEGSGSSDFDLFFLWPMG